MVVVVTVGVIVIVVLTGVLLVLQSSARFGDCCFCVTGPTKQERPVGGMDASPPGDWTHQAGASSRGGGRLSPPLESLPHLVKNVPSVEMGDV